MLAEQIHATAVSYALVTQLKWGMLANRVYSSSDSEARYIWQLDMLLHLGCYMILLDDSVRWLFHMIFTWFWNAPVIVVISVLQALSSNKVQSGPDAGQRVSSRVGRPPGWRETPALRLPASGRPPHSGTLKDKDRSRWRRRGMRYRRRRGRKRKKEGEEQKKDGQ